MGPNEKATLIAAIVTGVMVVWNRIIIRRRRNIQERIEAERELQDELNEKYLERERKKGMH